MTRQDAMVEQERLFPRGIWREYLNHSDPHPDNRFRSVPLTLADIALQVRAATNGSADPWEPDSMREVIAMLRTRYETWEVGGGRAVLEWGMDEAVRVMVYMAINMGEAWLSSHGLEPT